MTANNLPQWLPQVLLVLPLVGVYLVALTMALTHWRRARKAALLVLAAALLSLANLAGQRLIWSVLIPNIANNGWARHNVQWVSLSISFMAIALQAAAIFLLVLAAFTDRRRED